MKFKAPPKRKKLDEPSASSSVPTPDVSPLKKRYDVVMQLINRSTDPETKTSSVSTMTELGTKTAMAQATQPGIVDPKIQQARNFAVAQAQQDACKGNYKVFDSSFGNYLIPVIPTRAELGE